MTSTPITGMLLGSAQPGNARTSKPIDTKAIRKEFDIQPDEEAIIQFACVLEGKKQFEGFAILFTNYLCFRSHSQARLVSLSIPLGDITELETKMSSLIIPNQIKIGTKLKTYLLTVDSQERDTVFHHLLEQWKLSSIRKKHGNIIKTLDNISKRISNVKEKLAHKGVRYNVDPSLDMFLYTTLKLPQTEALINHYACALEEGRAVVPAGRLYITQNYIVFHENIRFTRARHEIIDFLNISSMEKRNSNIWSLPNAIQIITYNQKLSFSSFFNRNEVYDLLKECWHAVRKRKGLVIEDNDDSDDEDEELKSDFDEIQSSDDYEDDEAPKSYFEFKGYIDDSPEDITLDMYGFEVPREYLSQYQAEILKYKKTLARQRRAWRYFRASHNLDSHIQHHTPELMTLIRRGIPFELRGELWYLFSGAKEKKEASKVAYSDLTTQVTSYSSDIGKDLRRTFPYHPAYQSDESLKRLERVLIAYANRNPSIGYCQSMNFVTALLLLFMPEEDAFWVLVTIVEDRLQDYFSESMVGTIVDQEVFEELLRQKFPPLMDHIEGKGLPLAVVTTRWFMCLYIGALPTETVLRVWDLFFFHGSPVIITTALSLIKMYEDDLQSITSTEKFMSYSTEFGMACFNVEALFRIAFNVVGLLDNRHLNYIRARYWETTKDYLEVENKKRDIYLLERCTHYSAKELEAWYKEWCDAKLISVQTRGDCTPRDTLGVDFESFKDIVDKLAPAWSSENASELLRKLFNYLDSNNDQLLDFKEMVTGMSVISRGTPDDKIELFFKMFGKKRQPLNNEQLIDVLLALYKLYYHNEYPPNIRELYKEYTSVNLSQLIDLVNDLPIFNRSELQPIRTASGRLISMEAKPIPMASYSIHEDYMPTKSPH